MLKDTFIIDQKEKRTYLLTNKRLKLFETNYKQKMSRLALYILYSNL